MNDIQNNMNNDRLASDNQMVINIIPRVPSTSMIIHRVPSPTMIIPRNERTVCDRYQRLGKKQRIICWCFSIFLLIFGGVVGFGIYFGVSLCKLMC